MQTNPRPSALLPFLLIVLLAAVWTPAVSARDPEAAPDPYREIHPVPIPLELPSKTVLGQDYAFPKGTPLIKAFQFTLGPGEKTSLHKHAVPLLAYIVSGKLKVDYGSRGERSFSPGQAYIEAIDWCHTAHGAGTEPVEILGFYLGQQDPDQTAPEPCDSED